MSSRAKSEKSAKISSSLMPPARCSSASYTVIRVPLMRSFPSHAGVYRDPFLPVPTWSPLRGGLGSARSNRLYLTRPPLLQSGVVAFWHRGAAPP